jgi:predicted amidophosphoribosyltransferase
VSASQFLYCVHTAIGGFDPRDLPARLVGRDRLALEWPGCASAPAPGDEVAIVVHASRGIREGVYVEGVVDSLDESAGQVVLRVDRLAAAQPLSEPTILPPGSRVRWGAYDEVFMLPDDSALVRVCALDSSASLGRRRKCHLPIVTARALAWPPRLSRSFTHYAPAFWVLAADAFLYQAERPVRAEVEAASGLCLRFKFGETALASALAIGIYEALSARVVGGFDCVTPIPLSPEKAAARRPHRARELALHVGELLGIELVELLSLETDISKGARRAVDGIPAAQFEAEYAERLKLDDVVRDVSRLLVVDDICQEGSTLTAGLAAIRSANHHATAVAAVAGQMATRAAVRDHRSLLA